MTLLVRQARIYEQVYYDRESDFQPVVKAELAKVLPNFSILDFSPYIIGDEGRRRKPDLALVDRSYRMWAIVEVELESHSLKNHVIPQIQAFATGDYGKSHAEILYEKDPTLDLDRLCNLTVYTLPTILVVVNSRSVLMDDWDILESEYSVHLTFLETFRSLEGDVVFSISGYFPVPPPDKTIKLKKHKMLNALVCSRPEDIPAAVMDKICIYWHERPLIWQVIRTADMVIFLAPGGFTVRMDRNYQAHKTKEGKYHLCEI